MTRQHKLQRKYVKRGLCSTGDGRRLSTKSNWYCRTCLEKKKMKKQLKAMIQAFHKVREGQ